MLRPNLHLKSSFFPLPSAGLPASGKGTDVAPSFLGSNVPNFSVKNADRFSLGQSNLTPSGSNNLSWIFRSAATPQSRVAAKAELSALQRLNDGFYDLEEVVGLITAAYIYKTTQGDAAGFSFEDVEKIVLQEGGPEALRELLRGKVPVHRKALKDDIYQTSDAYRSIVELVSNALDASPDAKVRVACADGRYTVEDSGTGMDAGILMKLLLPKSSGKLNPNLQTGRFGIGFYTALRHLQEHGDQVVVETRSAGEAGYRLVFRNIDGKISFKQERLSSEATRARWGEATGTKVEVEAKELKREALHREAHHYLRYIPESRLKIEGLSFAPPQLKPVFSRKFAQVDENLSGEPGLVVIKAGDIVVEQFHYPSRQHELILQCPVGVDLSPTRDQLKMTPELREFCRNYLEQAQDLPTLNQLSAWAEAWEGRYENCGEGSGGESFLGQLRRQARQLIAKHPSWRLYPDVEEMRAQLLPDEDAQWLAPILDDGSSIDRLPTPPEARSAHQITPSGVGDPAHLRLSPGVRAGIYFEPVKGGFYLDSEIYRTALPMVLSGLFAIEALDVRADWRQGLPEAAASVVESSATVERAPVVDRSTLREPLWGKVTQGLVELGLDARAVSVLSHPVELGNVREVQGRLLIVRDISTALEIIEAASGKLLANVESSERIFHHRGRWINYDHIKRQFTDIDTGEVIGKTLSGKGQVEILATEEKVWVAYRSVPGLWNTLDLLSEEEKLLKLFSTVKVCLEVEGKAFAIVEEEKFFSPSTVSELTESLSDFSTPLNPFPLRPINLTHSLRLTHYGQSDEETIREEVKNRPLAEFFPNLEEVTRDIRMDKKYSLPVSQSILSLDDHKPLTLGGRTEFHSIRVLAPHILALEVEEGIFQFYDLSRQRFVFEHESCAAVVKTYEHQGKHYALVQDAEHELKLLSVTDEQCILNLGEISNFEIAGAAERISWPPFSIGDREVLEVRESDGLEGFYDFATGKKIPSPYRNIDTFKRYTVAFQRNIYSLQFKRRNKFDRTQAIQVVDLNHPERSRQITVPDSLVLSSLHSVGNTVLAFYFNSPPMIGRDVDGGYMDIFSQERLFVSKRLNTPPPGNLSRVNLYREGTNTYQIYDAESRQSLFGGRKFLADDKVECFEVAGRLVAKVVCDLDLDMSVRAQAAMGLITPSDVLWLDADGTSLFGDRPVQKVKFVTNGQQSYLYYLEDNQWHLFNPIWAEELLSDPAKRARIREVQAAGSGLHKLLWAVDRLTEDEWELLWRKERHVKLLAAFEDENMLAYYRTNRQATESQLETAAEWLKIFATAVQQQGQVAFFRKLRRVLAKPLDFKQITAALPEADRFHDQASWIRSYLTKKSGDLLPGERQLSALKTPDQPLESLVVKIKSLFPDQRKVEAVATDARELRLQAIRREIDHAINHLHLGNPYVFVQQFLQNSYDAKADRIDVDVVERDGKLLISFRDNGVGMDEEAFLRLFEPGEGTKGGMAGQVGRFGIGFFSSLATTGWLRLRTAPPSSDRVFEAELEKSDGEHRVKLDRAANEKNFSGTWIELEIADEDADIAVERFQTTLRRMAHYMPRDEVQAHLRGELINHGQKPLLEEPAIPGLGPVAIYDGLDNCILLGSFPLADLPEDLWREIPAPIREFFKRQKFYLQLDPDFVETVPTRDRFRDEAKVLELLRAHLPGLLVKAYLQRVLDPKYRDDLHRLPEDAFAERPPNFGAPSQEEQDAAHIAAGRYELVDFSRYVSEKKLMRLISFVPFIPWEHGGERGLYSVQQVYRIFREANHGVASAQERLDSLETSSVLPPALRYRIARERQMQWVQQQQQGELEHAIAHPNLKDPLPVVGMEMNRLYSREQVQDPRYRRCLDLMHRLATRVQARFVAGGNVDVFLDTRPESLRGRVWVSGEMENYRLYFPFHKALKRWSERLDEMAKHPDAAASFRMFLAFIEEEKMLRTFSHEYTHVVTRKFHLEDEAEDESPHDLDFHRDHRRVHLRAFGDLTNEELREMWGEMRVV